MSFQPLIYFSNKPREKLGNTAMWLSYFNLFVRNDDDYIKDRTTDAFLADFPCRSIEVFLVMRSNEATHVPAVVQYINKKKVSYADWLAFIHTSWADLMNDVCKILTHELDANKLWHCYEMVGWTADKRVQNPATITEAFRFTGYSDKPVHHQRNKTDV